MAISHAVGALALPISAADRIRSGWSSTSVSAIHPPMECPAMRTGSTQPRWSSSATVSAAMPSTL